jgi:hypothetical protein
MALKVRKKFKTSPARKSSRKQKSSLGGLGKGKINLGNFSRSSKTSTRSRQHTVNRWNPRKQQSRWLQRNRHRKTGYMQPAYGQYRYREAPSPYSGASRSASNVFASFTFVFLVLVVILVLAFFI